VAEHDAWHGQGSASSGVTAYQDTPAGAQLTLAAQDLATHLPWIGTLVPTPNFSGH